MRIKWYDIPILVYNEIAIINVDLDSLEVRLRQWWRLLRAYDLKNMFRTSYFILQQMLGVNDVGKLGIYKQNAKSKIKSR